MSIQHLTFQVNEILFPRVGKCYSKIMRYHEVGRATRAQLTCGVFSGAGGRHPGDMVDADSLSLLCGQSVRQLRKQHGGLECKQVDIKNKIVLNSNSQVHRDREGCVENYLAADDVDDRFINTNRKLQRWKG